MRVLTYYLPLWYVHRANVFLRAFFLEFNLKKSNNYCILQKLRFFLGHGCIKGCSKNVTTLEKKFWILFTMSNSQKSPNKHVPQ